MDHYRGKRYSERRRRTLRLLLTELQGQEQTRLAAALRQAGVDVVTAADAQALRRELADPRRGACASSFDAVVAWGTLADRRGLELLRSVRCYDGRTPFVILDAALDQGSAAEAARLRARLVAPPCDLPRLLTEVRRAVAAPPEALDE